MSGKLVPLTPPHQKQDFGESKTVFPSGRTVQISLEGKEQIQVFSPSGELEVSLQFSEKGPVLKLRGAQLQLDATEEIRVQCSKFTVATTEETNLSTKGNINMDADGELRIKTTKATHIDGEMLYLNCDEENQELGSATEKKEDLPK